MEQNGDKKLSYGASVRQIGLEDIYEIYYMRVNYEMMAVKLYGSPFPEETLMRQILEQMM